jgi:tetrapyrrole methylase family protein / MazG family protein
MPLTDPRITEAAAAFQELLAIMARLRSPEGGCPWDLEQTLTSLGPMLLEETYEVISAAESSTENLKEELGDLTSLIALYCQIATDESAFTASDVLRGICEKLVRRHPHVFGDAAVSGTGDVLRNWEKIKQSEGTSRKYVLDSVPAHLPALLKAQRVSEKCARVGFEWKNFSEIKEKVVEELNEFLEAANESPDDRAHQEEEFGDLLFALVQVARRMDFSAEDLLRRATDKFMRRFRSIEELAYHRGNGTGIKDLTLEAMDSLWEEVKAAEKRGTPQS